MFTNDPYYCTSDAQWNVGRYFDTLVATLYPMNLGFGNGAGPLGFNGYTYYSTTTAGSYHPGGANFGFCDGSVRFLKNSISSWTFNSSNADSYGDTMPDNTTFSSVTATAPYSRTGNYLLMSMPAVSRRARRISTTLDPSRRRGCQLRFVLRPCLVCLNRLPSEASIRRGWPGFDPGYPLPPTFPGS